MFSHTVQHLKRSLPRHQFVPRRFASGESTSKPSLEDAFATLGLDVNSSPEECRQSYLRLAKQLHPDSVTAPSNEPPNCRSAAFQHLHEAYQIAYSSATRTKNEQFLNMNNDLDETVIHHRAPQHRQYLENDSANLGSAVVTGLTPSERQKQLQTQRFVKGVYASADYRLERLQECGMICDDLETTTELAPVNRHKYGRRPVKEFHEDVKRINRSIDRYNLMVPALHLQRCHVNATSMVREILLQSKETSPEKNIAKKSSESAPPPNADDDADEGIQQDHTPKEDKDTEKGDKKLWDPRYLGELMRDFYRELARAYVSMMRGFKNHR